MDAWWIAALLGGLSGGLLVAGHRWPLLAWVALAPLGVLTVSAEPGAAAFGGGIAGALGNLVAVWSPTMRPLLPLNVGLGMVAWAIAFGAGAWLLPPQAVPWVALVLPAVTVLALWPARLAGAPRWASNPIARTQEVWLPVVHTARLGGDLVTAATLALASASLVLILVGAGLVRVEGASAVSSLLAAALALAVVGGVLLFGWLSARAAVRRADASPVVRVAAVVVDGPDPPGGQASGLWPIESPDYRDVEATVRRYEPHVQSAGRAGARLVVLPEVCVHVDEAGRARWLAAVTRWATVYGITIVAPYFDGVSPRNELVVVDERGVVGEYEKQHPAPRMEPPRSRITPPGPHPLTSDGEPVGLSTVICVDLDYPDLLRPVRATGGLLAAPSNDWLGGFEELHHRTAVWAAVLSGVTVVRSTGHGVSSVIDGAGRVLARKTSAGGPVVLLVDAPVTVGGRPPRAG